MKNFFMALLVALTLVGCGPAREVVQATKGDTGAQGPAGNNGHSLVATAISDEEQCEAGGQGLASYLDLDDSNDVSEGDLFQSSFIACNGVNGQDGKDGQDGVGTPGTPGPQGAPGPAGSGATIQNYALGSSCVSIGDSLYAKASGSDIKIYGNSSCSSSGSGLLYSISQDESVWVTGTRVGYNVGGANLRIVKY